MPFGQAIPVSVLVARVRASLPDRTALGLGPAWDNPAVLGRSRPPARYDDVPGEGYRSPHTSHGVHLTPLARLGLSAFLVHETGYLPRGLRWRFPRVRSPFWRLYYNHDPGSHVAS